MLRILTSVCAGLLVGVSVLAAGTASPVARAAQTIGEGGAESGAEPDAMPTSTPTPAATATPRGVPSSVASSYRAASPEYGMNVFLWDNPDSTERDLNKLRGAGFGWQKTLFQWRDIEPTKGHFDWREADRVVAASHKAGIKIIARLDFQPRWARADGAHNGPPDDHRDFARFAAALVARYGSSSQIGRVHAIQVWNEPNLDREWGLAPITPQAAADYTQLLRTAYVAVKAADPSVTVISAGLSPTGTDNDFARPDDVYLQWLYDAGARPYFDVLGAHGPGYKAPPSVSPDEAEQDPFWGGHRSFTFRRVEDLRQVMEANGDAAKQVWLLEFGWTTDLVNPAYAWHRVTQEQHAQYILDAYKWAHRNWAPWIGVMALWNLPDPRWAPDREELWWAVAGLDGADRPALTRLAQARRTGELP